MTTQQTQPLFHLLLNAEQQDFNPIKGSAHQGVPNKLWVARCLPGNLHGYGDTKHDALSCLVKLLFTWFRHQGGAEQALAWWQTIVDGLNEDDREEFENALHEGVRKGRFTKKELSCVAWPEGCIPSWLLFGDLDDVDFESLDLEVSKEDSNSFASQSN